jgi:hypothetical protein
VPSAVSCSVAGCCSRPPAAPAKNTGEVAVCVVVTVEVVDEDVVTGAAVDVVSGVVVVDAAEATLVTVLVVVEAPQPAIARAKAAATIGRNSAQVKGSRSRRGTYRRRRGRRPRLKTR